MSAAAISYGDVVHDVLVREYGHHRNAAKALARDARATPRAAENWLAGTHAPNGDKLINLLARCEALAEEIDRLIKLRRAARGED